jgi:hypothetical protein
VAPFTADTCACSAQWRFHRAQQREAPADTLLQCRRALFRVRDEVNGALGCRRSCEAGGEPPEAMAGRIATRFANFARCLIGIEAGMVTHCVGRELIALGHDVKQVPPSYAKPFRQGRTTGSPEPDRTQLQFLPLSFCHLTQINARHAKTYPVSQGVTIGNL